MRLYYVHFKFFEGLWWVSMGSGAIGGLEPPPLDQLLVLPVRHLHADVGSVWIKI
jgi:hypothetical protein